jgi:hypothetical protein
MASEYLGRIEDVELTTAEGDLAVRPSGSNVYAGEIDVLSVRWNVRKGQGSVRETGLQGEAGRDAGAPRERKICASFGGSIQGVRL